MYTLEVLVNIGTKDDLENGPPFKKSSFGVSVFNFQGCM